MALLLFSLSSILLSLTFRFGPISTDAGNSSEYLLVNCGASGQLRDGYGRTWEGDDASSYLREFSGSSEISASYLVENSTLLQQVPYKTARYSYLPLFYSLPVSRGRKFLRLHFYQLQDLPSPDDALFSLTAASTNQTFLIDYGIDVDGQGQTYVVREFCIDISQPSPPSSSDLFLNLTFEPLRSGAYVFINGIEIMSIPDDLFTFASPLSDDAPSPYPIKSGVVLETMVRINVGGHHLRPDQDSGLFREWFADSPYIDGAGKGVPYFKDSNVTIDYKPSNVSTYIAPKDVYASARSTDTNRSVTYNITWSFPGDERSRYLVRLHLCKIRYTVAWRNDSIVTFVMENKTADVNDLGGMGVPEYRDFLVRTPNFTNQFEFNVSLIRSTTSNAGEPFLNGVELFKLNPKHTPFHYEGGKNITRTSISVGPVVAVVIFLSVLAIFTKKYCCCRNKKGEMAATTDNPFAGIGASSICRRFTFAELEDATSRFDESRLLGRGGFGNVYWGTIDDGRIKVAIKRGNLMSGQGMHEFRTEIEMLSKLRHRHLVSLIGYCQERGEMMLVYDYMANGTLRQHLYRTQRSPPLPWKQRLRICIGAARGLHYLHTGSKQTIIHRDVKSTNILLDEAWVAKVSDFGLSKNGPVLEDNRHVSTAVKGSFGYMDPEYVRRLQLSEKSDVYSFGVVMFEVLCARPAVDANLPEEEVSLASWALNRLRNGRLEEIIDPSLVGTIDALRLDRFVRTAEKCLADRWADRPTMADVLWNLECAQETTEGDDGGAAVDLESAVDIQATSGSVANRANFDGLTPSGERSVFSMIKNIETR